ncbi:DUF1642 domain-containing protein [Streptococcus oralis]|uniref:DUF1642 domain-containing protein n=1 Tax=Streptococcus oralis TaxID=1303 RepID=UPI0019D0F9F6|nr:DUF1642 domain-containing protein [Streptococcus oralis]MBN6014124.1 DUF1642 domain-containing protein [Streptococcus oralis subsp. oralis]
MNKQELIERIEGLDKLYGEKFYVALDDVLDLVKQLDEPEKPIRLKDVIKRIQGFDDETKFKWTYDILQEFGSDFGSKIFHEAYQQGKFERSWVGNQLKDADKIRQELNKPVVKQFVADWYEENKDVFEGNLYRFVYNLTSIFDGAKLNEFERWFLTAGTKPFQTLINMHQFGYEIEKEPKYTVRVKGINGYGRYLNKALLSKEYFFASENEVSGYRTKHTRKELEDAGFGWVFGCEGIEIEEVTE